MPQFKIVAQVEAQNDVSCPACPSWLSVARTEETEEKS